MIEYLLLLWLAKCREAFLLAAPPERIERGLEIGAGIEIEDAPEPEHRRPELRLVK